ncbi:hypothetical protein GCM10011583_48170 [Streptomyces camponoticapitis]|uniref:H repeat-associated protein N-terminal domain-containing protein n=1 Tax=Streptomyces camponoticapitis TaxID=1616125 RepID=A0ABQ2EFD2_9ACTN|nr:hypothetical protein GCM10011583_48170 [Streptomyces camponoticapitis]
MCRQSATVCLTKSPAAAQRAVSGIAERLAVLRDPRHRRGRRHSLVAVVLTACCAVLAGARSYLAVGQWARHAPQDTLARLGVRAVGPLGVRRAASGSTIRRILAVVCPGGLADLLGCDPAGAAHLAVDGKCARGSRTACAPAAHLLSAVLPGGRTVSRLRVPARDASPQAIGKLARRSGASRPSTTSETPRSARTPPGSETGTARRTRPRSAASRSAPCAPPGTTASPAACARSPTSPSPSHWT